MSQVGKALRRQQDGLAVRMNDQFLATKKTANVFLATLVALHLTPVSK